MPRLNFWQQARQATFLRRRKAGNFLPQFGQVALNLDCGKATSDSRKRAAGVPPISATFSRQSASCAWRGPTSACAISCKSVSRIFCGGFNSVNARDKEIVRVVKLQQPKRLRARSNWKFQSDKSCFANKRQASVSAAERFTLVFQNSGDGFRAIFRIENRQDGRATRHLQRRVNVDEVIVLVLERRTSEHGLG